MRGDPVPDADHVVRYVKPRSFEDGVIDAGGFELGEGHKGISVNWLECFDGDKQAQLAEVRRLKRLTWRRNGCLAELNVGQTRWYLSKEIPDILILEDPLDPDPQEGYEADPSHSLICGVPHDPPERRQAIQDMIAECVINTYPALV